MNLISKRSHLLKVSLCGVSLVLTSLGLASTILDPSDAPGVTDQMYRDLGASHPEVGQVQGSGFGGSGVYIGGRWVLTAGHVSFAKAGGTFSVSGQNYTILRSISAPGYSFGSDMNDVGLLELTSAVIGVTPAVMISLTDDAVLLGQQATWVGYGKTGTGLTGDSGNPGTLRGFTNNIDGFGPTLGLVTSSMFSDFDRPDGSKNSVAGSNPLPTALEGNVAPGDSGGAVYLEGLGLVGVISYRGRLTSDPFSNSDYGELSGASRLNQFTDWITLQTGIPAVPVPEPAGATLMAFALSLFLRRRR
jgi:secreted trypsin-like serine protease